MLSLWSFPNVYTDEGKKGNGDGKELCDLMVVFENDVILFSDKECAFSDHQDIGTAWSRWYRRAILRSAKQLAGAESWITRFPNRIFLDAACTAPVPIPLPDLASRRVHLIAVAHGSMQRAEEYWNAIGPGSSGSLILNTSIVGDAHHEHPFHVGWPLSSKRFVHVLDDLTLSLLMEELDTVSDFVDYLTKKQRLLESGGTDFMVLGEEELLAMYLQRITPEGDHQFPKFDVGATVFLGEGEWKRFQESPEYQSRKEANEVSYVWDDLIEYQASHMLHGSSSTIEHTSNDKPADQLLRTMASETRLQRRALGESVRAARAMSCGQRRFVRCLLVGGKRRVYAFIGLPHVEPQPYKEFQEYRQYLLEIYCHGAALKFPGTKEIIGIALPPYDASIASVDFLQMAARGGVIDPPDDEWRAQLGEFLKRENLWQRTDQPVIAFRAQQYPFRPSRSRRIFRSILALLGRVELWLTYRVWPRR